MAELSNYLTEDQVNAMTGERPFLQALRKMNRFEELARAVGETAEMHDLMLRGTPLAGGLENLN